MSQLTQHQKVQRLRKSFAITPQFQGGNRWYCGSQSIIGKGYYLRVSFVREVVPGRGLTSSLDIYCPCPDHAKNKTCKHAIAVIREYDGDYKLFFHLFPNVTNYKTLNAAIDAHLAQLQRGVAA